MEGAAPVVAAREIESDMPDQLKVNHRLLLFLRLLYSRMHASPMFFKRMLVTQRMELPRLPHKT